MNNYHLRSVSKKDSPSSGSKKSNSLILSPSFVKNFKSLTATTPHRKQRNQTQNHSAADQSERKKKKKNITAKLTLSTPAKLPSTPAKLTLTPGIPSKNMMDSPFLQKDQTEFVVWEDPCVEHEINNNNEILPDPVPGPGFAEKENTPPVEAPLELETPVEPILPIEGPEKREILVDLLPSSFDAYKEIQGETIKISSSPTSLFYINQFKAPYQGPFGHKTTKSYRPSSVSLFKKDYEKDGLDMNIHSPTTPRRVNSWIHPTRISHKKCLFGRPFETLKEKQVDVDLKQKVNVYQLRPRKHSKA